MRHLLDVTDFTAEELNELMACAADIKINPEKYRERCRYKKLATLFFEPSTRTRLSFEAAMLELGGSVIGFDSGANSSASKGETVGDTVRTVSCYADIIAMRHPSEGAPYAAVQKSLVPIINAGDGGHNHPTQTLADLMTVRSRKNRLDNLTIGLCGDLKYGRTVHSLIRAMLRYPNNRFVLISPRELSLPDYMTQLLKECGAPFKTAEDMRTVMGELDVLYMTRVQRERFDSAEEYERLKDSCILTAEKLSAAKQDMCVLHPLPRVNEIEVEVDDDPRACYFEQVAYGKLMRMALILRLLEAAQRGESAPNEERTETSCRCGNPKCITAREESLKSYSVTRDGKERCYYCESLLK